jgi:hypothetical protein
MSPVTVEARDTLTATINNALRTVPGAQAHADLIYAAAERYAKALCAADQEAAARRLEIAAAEYRGKKS